MKAINHNPTLALADTRVSSSKRIVILWWTVYVMLLSHKKYSGLSQFPPQVRLCLFIVCFKVWFFMDPVDRIESCGKNNFSALCFDSLRPDTIVRRPQSTRALTWPVLVPARLFSTSYKRCLAALFPYGMEIAKVITDTDFIKLYKCDTFYRLVTRHAISPPKDGRRIS